MKERTIVINGFSKAFAMTGWRLGYACGPKEIISQMTKLHQYAIMCAPTNSQFVAVEALKNCDMEVEKMVTAYDQRRRYLMHAFKEMGIDCFMYFHQSRNLDSHRKSLLTGCLGNRSWL